MIQRSIPWICRVLAAAIAFLVVAIQAFAAEDLAVEHRLPLTSALQAATAAIESCKASGASVSVSVVDQHGQLLLKLQGDGAAPHTMNLSEQKAFTAVSLAPIQGVDSTSKVAANLRSKRQSIGDLALPSSSIPGIIGLAGGVIIKTSMGETVGGIGVSGATSGIQDELCAHAGLAASAENLGFGQVNLGL